MCAHVLRQFAVLREGHAAGCAGVGAVSGMCAHVYRQFARTRAGLAADRAFEKVDLPPPPAPPSFARRSSTTAQFVP
jgi:hypothetical protein